MGQSSTEKLREFLGQLPPKSQALLIREFERAIERGDDPTVPNFVLGELRKIVRQDSENATPRSKDPARLLFAMLDPFLVDSSPKTSPGQIRRTSLAQVWQWLSREGLPADITALEEAVAGDTPDLDRTIRKIQMAAAEAINVAAAPGPDRQRMLARIGAPEMAEDIAAIGTALQIREALEALGTRLPGHLRVFAESQIGSVSEALNIPSLQTPQALPFALSLVMSRLAAPWQIIRLGITVAGSDDEVRVAGTSYGVAVTMAIQHLARIASDLRNDIRRGQFKDTPNHLKTLHDGMRGLRTELDLRSDSAWGRQLSAIRVEISNALQSEIDGVPGRVRRLLRQRPDKDIPNSRIDATEVEETAALIDFVAVCRNYASELAINEVTLRAYSDLQQYVEKATESLVESLRGSDAKAKAFRSMQVDAAIRFCDVLFGPDYASLMRKASGVARTGERKSSRAS